MRLNKYLSAAGVAARRKADELIANGSVTVNGKVATIGTIVNERRDKVCVLGKPVSLCEFVYFKMNKPKGYICSADDEKGRKTIFDLVEDKSVRLFSVGRLDYQTEGLILLTNDGDFTKLVSHPSHQTEKEYKTSVEGMLLESELAVLRAGVVIDGEKLPECKVKFLSYEDNVTKLSIVIDEGQNRQIRRMFEGIGRSIILLKRVRIGNVHLGGLKRGEMKEMTEDEIESLKR